MHAVGESDACAIVDMDQKKQVWKLRTVFGMGAVEAHKDTSVTECGAGVWVAAAVE